ncbi:interferon-inducible GTPase 5-like [Pristis pectinata]|uniref:interferon-inducible GTPase 5-like n=1 Tax=Pristis pectinata TaxID=685728 RepID=UPI00223CD7E1|nr:interferon-inducible GTPase 5-like [Pristis pectinata]
MMDSSSEYVFFNAQELKELESCYEKGGLGRFADKIVQKINNLSNIELHIAVTGESGTGKSTFINSMRGLRSKDKDGAKTGTTETTMEPTPYKHPSFPKVCFWDLPGVGTLKFPVKDYLNKMQFDRYEYFIIISRGRFTENDANLAKEIKSMGKKFYFVRTQIDNDLRSLEMEGISFDRNTELERIRNYSTEGLKEAGISNPIIFLISSFQVNEFDFPKLKETLADNLDDIKKDVFLMSLPSTTLKIVKQKENHLRKRIWMLAIVSGTVGAVPIPGLSFSLDLGILVTAIIEFRTCLGLDDASLQRLANVTKKRVEFLKAELKTPLVGEINEDVLKRILIGSAFFGISAAEMALDLVPIVGSIFGSVSSFGMTYKLLSNALNELVVNAQNVVKVAFDIDCNHP